MVYVNPLVWQLSSGLGNQKSQSAKTGLSRLSSHLGLLRAQIQLNTCHSSVHCALSAQQFHPQKAARCPNPMASQELALGATSDGQCVP